MLFADKLTFDHPRTTSDGYMVVRARAARAGIYDYLGSEIDPEGKTFAADQVVKVYRSEAEVFAQDSVASFLMKPVTNDHPSQPVTAANWRDYAKGVVGKALRDGEYLAFDIVLMDEKTIADVEAGKRELSNGYASLLDFTAGETEAGEHYDAVQKQIRGNHVAVVDKGRAGPLCRISDAASCEKLPGADLIAILTDERTYSDGREPHKTVPARRETSTFEEGSQVATKTITFDGLPVEVTDAAEAVITKLQGQLKDEAEKKAEANREVSKLQDERSKLQGEKAGLEKQLKDATDPATLQAAATARAALINKAISVSPNIVTDGKSDAEIRKEVVSAKLGDDAKDFDDAKIEGAFLSLTRDAPGADPVRDALRSGVRTNTNDSGASVRDLARAAQF
jgi:hypothetical protein